tara:strand:- start:2561 stop:3550 length:990 start_codon:yes stop_codon:yes gene_type:complete
MVQEVVQFQRQAPFIEDRVEKLLASVFGIPQIGEPGDPDFREGQEGLAGRATTIPAFEVAGLSPQQQAAIKRAQEGLGAYQPFLDAAGTTIGTGLGALSAAQQTLDPNQISTFMDPFQQQVTQEALKELDRQAEMQSQRTAAEAVAAGAFGGSRFGVREAEEARNLAQVKSQRIFEDLSRNFLQAQQAQARTAQQLGTLGTQTLQAAQGQAGLGQLGQQLASRDIDRLLGLGQLTQQFGFVDPTTQAFVPGQAQIEAARATTLAEQKEPFERVAFASDILRGVPSSQITYSQSPSPSLLQQVAGLGIAGLGAYGNITGGLGGISSLFGG